MAGGVVGRKRDKPFLSLDERPVDTLFLFCDSNPQQPSPAATSLAAAVVLFFHWLAIFLARLD